MSKETETTSKPSSIKLMSADFLFTFFDPDENEGRGGCRVIRRGSQFRHDSARSAFNFQGRMDGWIALPKSEEDRILDVSRVIGTSTDPGLKFRDHRKSCASVEVWGEKKAENREQEFVDKRKALKCMKELRRLLNDTRNLFRDYQLEFGNTSKRDDFDDAFDDLVDAYREFSSLKVEDEV